MARNVTKRITWKKDPVAQPEEVKRLRPIVRVLPRSDEHVFVPGQLFRVLVAMEALAINPRHQPPPSPYLTESWYANGPMAGNSSTFVPRGSLAIFVGHTRVEELDGSHTRSLLRATFFIGGGKYLATNLNHFEFVS